MNVLKFIIAVAVVAFFAFSVLAQTPGVKGQDSAAGKYGERDHTTREALDAGSF